MAADLLFPVMGTQAHVMVIGGDPALAMLARHRLFDLEAKWSRFLPTSELSRLNRAAGSSMEVSPETLELIDRAMLGWIATDGRFDPTVLGDVVRAGYDTSFEAVAARSGPNPHPTDDRIAGCGGIVVDHQREIAALPAGVGFDAGGVGKGFAADLACRELMAAGAEGALVNVGGDVVVAGVAPDPAGWGIVVDDPFSDRPAALLSITRGAVATSSRLRRRWVDDAGLVRHHLIDPRTGLPATGTVATATVVASEGWRAEVLSKAVFLSTPDEATALVDRLGAACLTIDLDGHHHRSSRWDDFTRPLDAGIDFTTTSLGLEEVL